MTSRLILSIAGAVLLCASSAMAQDAEPAGNGALAACKTDIETLCKDTGDGRGKFKCLRENEAKVSDGCKSAMAANKAAREAARSACKSDRETLCKAAGEERGAGMKCLRENVAKVSPDCSKALAALPERGK